MNPILIILFFASIVMSCVTIVIISAGSAKRELNHAKIEIKNLRSEKMSLMQEQEQMLIKHVREIKHCLDTVDDLQRSVMDYKKT